MSIPCATPSKTFVFQCPQHDTLLVSSTNKSKSSIAGNGADRLDKLSKTEQYFLGWLKKAISERSKHEYRILDGKVWITKKQEELSQILNCTRIHIARISKKLKALGYIDYEKLTDMDAQGRVKKRKYKEGGFFKDHTLSYVLLERDLNVTNVTNNNESFLNLGKPKFINPYIKKEIGKTETTAKSTTIPCNQCFQQVVSELRVDEMIEIAREVLGNHPLMRVDKRLSRLMGAARNVYFQTEKKWRSFLSAVKKSPYLMGEKFKLSMKWLLKFRTIRRILAGEFGIVWEEEVRRSMTEKLRTEAENKEIIELQEVMAGIDNLEESKECKLIRRKAVRTYGVTKYRATLGMVRLQIADNSDPHNVKVTVLSDTDFFTEVVKKLELRGVTFVDSEDTALFNQVLEEIDSLSEESGVKWLRRRLLKRFGHLKYRELFSAVKFMNPKSGDGLERRRLSCEFECENSTVANQLANTWYSLGDCMVEFIRKPIKTSGGYINPRIKAALENISL